MPPRKEARKTRREKASLEKPQPEAPPQSSLAIRKYRYTLQIAAAALFLLLLAWHRFPIVHAEPGGRFEDPDASFHARRVERTIASDSWLPPVFDPFENFPEGGRAVWPPLHDASIALLARLGGSTPAAPGKGMPFAGIFPVLEILLCLLLASSLARRGAGDRAGVVTAWLFALTPWLARRAAYGEIDHNVTELLCGLVLLLVASRISETPEETRATRLVPAAILWGGAVLLVLGFYAGSVLTASIVASGFVALDFLDPRARGAHASRLALGFGFAALMLPLFAGLRIQPDATDPWRLGPVYVLVLAVASLGLSVAATVCGLVFARFERRIHGLALFGGALGITAALLQPRAAWSGFAKGLGFIGSRDPWLQTIDEFRPLLIHAGALGKTMPAFLVASVALLACLVLRARRALSTPLLALVPSSVAFLLLAILTFAQSRFVLPAIAFGAVAAGSAWSFSFTNPLARWSNRIAFVAGVFSSSWFVLAMLGATFHPGDAPLDTAWPGEQAGLVLKRIAPLATDPPTWGVLAPWGEGHHLLRASGQAVALNPFGSFHPGFEKKLRLFLEASPAKAAEAMDSLKLRYVVVESPFNVVPDAALSLGEDPALYVTGPGHRGAETLLGQKTLCSRLFVLNAEPFTDDTEADRLALKRFHAVWNPTEQAVGPDGRPLPRFKIFELLPSG